MNPAHKKGMLPVNESYTFKKGHTKSAHQKGNIFIDYVSYKTSKLLRFASPSSGAALIPHIWVANRAG